MSKTQLSVSVETSTASASRPPRRSRSRPPSAPAHSAATHWLTDGVDGGAPVQARPFDAGFGDVVTMAQGRDAAAPAALTGVNAVVRSGGQPLAAATRDRFESRFGVNLGGVRLHEDERAAASTRDVGARAFTVGRHIAIDPAAVPAGERDHVLAHELAHVAQQRGRDTSPVHSIAGADHPLERHAERAADAATRGSSVAAAGDQAPDGVLFRQPRPGQPAATTTAAPTAKDRREFVDDSVRFMQGAASYYADVARNGSAEPFGNPASMRRVLAGFRAMMSGQGTMILDDLGGDPQLYQGLRASYLAAVAALLGGAASVAKRPVNELYETYRDAILEWAMPTQQIAGITTPLPPSAQQDPSTHLATVGDGGVHLEFAPDIQTAAGPRAETSFHLTFATPGFKHHAGHVTEIAPVAAIIIHVQTRYPRNLDPAGRSGYGRGTTREDIAAGNTTFRFHEGQHGTDIVRFVREHSAPQFGGRVGMTVAEFHAAGAKYRRAINAYSAALDANTLRGTDCVGTTIDQFNAQHGDRRVQCVP